MTSSHTGILLVNLGTPESPAKKPVRAYLSEFLADRRVVDLPAPWRQLLVKGFILPFRPKVSSHAYQQIWTQAGSPLLIHSQQLAKGLAVSLGENYRVALAMRYGQPNIVSGLRDLRMCRKIIVSPLFPQYSSAATGSVLEKVFGELQTMNDIPNVSTLHSFHDHPAFINAWKTVITEHCPQKPQMWVFSFHGLPVRHLVKRGCPAACWSQTQCSAEAAHAIHCYRRQCYATAALLANSLGLCSDQYRVAFQSRLGRIPWITPYTDHLLADLAGQGIKNLAIACPSFVADCLETLEEIGIRARTQWRQLGGGEFTLIPSLNAHPVWVNGLSEILRQLS